MTTTPAPLPSLLASRLRRAREARDQRDAADKAATLQPTRAPTNPPPPTRAAQPPKPASANPKPPPQIPAGNNARRMHKTRGDVVEAGGASQASAPGDPVGVAGHLRALSSRPDAIALVADAELEALWRAMLDGAAKAGPIGNADRQALFRALGLPFAPGIVGAGGVGAGVGTSLGGVLEGATSRVLAMRRHGGVTRPDDDGEEAAEVLGFEGDGPQSTGQGAVPEAAEPVEIEPRREPFGQPRSSLGRALGLEPGEEEGGN